MNSNTGEIREFTKGEARPLEYDTPMTQAEKEILEMVEPSLRKTIMKNWKDKESFSKFNGIIEKLKVKNAFLEGAVMGIFLAQDQEKLGIPAQADTLHESSPSSEV